MRPRDPLTSPACLLAAEGVGKTYATGTRALDAASVEIGHGDFVALLGPSGCGKSTLLRMFAGLEQPTEGRIVRRNAEGAAAEPRLAVVFQEATLMPWADVRRNAALPLELQGCPRDEVDGRVERALALVGLAGFAAAYPRELSGGMQMRAALARALVVEPELLLLDEPFGALDEFTRNRLDGDLWRLWVERGLTVVFVTHSIYEAVFLSTRVVVMGARPGRILADVAIEGPAVRDDEFRVSPAFLEHCRALSDLLRRAHGETDPIGSIGNAAG